MTNPTLFDKIDLHLIKVLHTVLTERSVSKAAIRLGMHQPAVSASLKRLRDYAGDPLLVRSGGGMVPTDAALRMVAPAASILQAAAMLFSDARGFEPSSARNTFRVAASDYLDPLFLPQLVRYEGLRMGVNYGCDKVRFPAPVPVGARVRGQGLLTEAKALADGGVHMVVRITVEIENAPKPGCVADTISRLYF